MLMFFCVAMPPPARCHHASLQRYIVAADAHDVLSGFTPPVPMPTSSSAEFCAMIRREEAALSRQLARRQRALLLSRLMMPLIIMLHSLTAAYFPHVTVATEY